MIRRTVAPLAGALLLLAGLGGCATPGADGTGADAPPAARAEATRLRMDETIGTYGGQREKRLILVLMEADVHDALAGTTPETTPEEESELALSDGYARYLRGLGERHGVTRVADWPLATIGVRCLVFEVERPAARADAIAALEAEPGVRSAQPMQTFAVLRDPADDDPGSEENDPLRGLQTGLLATQAERSHRWANGEGVLVAVIDTGLDVAHPDLVDRLDEPRNFVDADERRFADDVHGTAVAGIIAASAGNRTGMVGMAPRASVLPLKACWQSDETGERASCNSFTLAKALNVAIASEADVINLSLTGPPDPLLEALVAEALARGTIVIGARGDGAERAFPADVAGTLAVVSGRGGSGRGESGEAVATTPGTLAAPGERILSTRPAGEYGFFSGSSFASAHVAGLAALVRQIEPRADSRTFAELLSQTSDPSTDEINACRTIARLRGASPDECV